MSAETAASGDTVVSRGVATWAETLDDPVVVSRRAGGDVMHLPHPNSEGPRPLCATGNVEGTEWSVKERRVFAGFRPVCERCRRAAGGDGE
jgi:hypothetical protein